MEESYENMFFSRYVFIKISEHYVSFFMLWLVNGWLCLQYENIFSICPRWANNGDYEAKTMVARLTTEHYHGQHPAPGRHACTACLMLTQPYSPTAFLRSSNTWRKLLLKLSFWLRKQPNKSKCPFVSQCVSALVR